MKNNIQAEHNLRIEVMISLILGISGIIIVFFNFFIGLLIQISGLILGIRGLLKSSKKTLAIISIVLCITGAIVAVAWNSQKNRMFSCYDGGGALFCGSFVFEKICETLNGHMLQVGMHPMSGSEYYCYKNTPDAGQECGSYNDCAYGCDLSVALEEKKCVLISNEPQGYSEDYNGEKVDLFKKTYKCNQLKPGRCNAGAGLLVGHGPDANAGFDYYLKMEGEYLIETKLGAKAYIR